MQPLRRMVLLAFIAGLFPAWAHAQGNRIELGGTYGFTQVGEEKFPIGWAADAALPLHARLWFVGEGSGVYDTAEAVHGELRTTTDSSLYAAGVGVRWYASRGRRVWPFVQVLIGPVWARTSRKFEPLTGPVPTELLETFDHTEAGAAVQFGLGANIRFSNRLAGRISLDYRLMHFENVELGTRATRVSGGLALLLGGQ